MANENPPIGKLYTHVYLDRSKTIKDSPQFRKRIGYYLQTCLYKNERTNIAASYFKIEMGLDVPYNYDYGIYNFESFFERIDISLLLNAITLAFQWINKSMSWEAHGWKSFVERALKEENLSYILDEQCGIHPLVDEEFERNRVSALRCLDDSRYSGVRNAFEHAFKELDSNPPHTKDAVRSIFESIEILVKQMVTTKNLNKSVVQNQLKGKALEKYKDDPIAKESVSKIFMGFGEWVDAMHNYRHGQVGPEPVEPPLDFAIYALSSGASFLRWLVSINTTR